MDTNEKMNRLREAFVEMKLSGRIKNQSDMAELLQIARTSLSAAMNGDERYLTDNLIAKLNSICDKPTTDTTPDGETILVIPTGARGGTLGDFVDSVHSYECERIVSPIKGAQYAMQVTGDSMSPEYPSGSQVVIKQVNQEQFIEWGRVYVLDTNNGAVIKQVFPSADPEKVECRSLNPAYPPFLVPTAAINGWFRVLMVMSLK